MLNCRVYMTGSIAGEQMDPMDHGLYALMVSLPHVLNCHVYMAGSIAGWANGSHEQTPSRHTSIIKADNITTPSSHTSIIKADTRTHNQLLYNLPGQAKLSCVHGLYALMVSVPLMLNMAGVCTWQGCVHGRECRRWASYSLWLVCLPVAAKTRWDDWYGGQKNQISLSNIE